MPRGIIALVFRAKVTGGRLATTDETAAFRWATATEVSQLATEAYAVRVLDSLRDGSSPAIRQHDGIRIA
jgi:8-oxo-dGTP diphosphatase